MVTSNVVSPGPSKTNFGGRQPGMAGVFIGVMKHMPMFHSAEEGSRTLVFATTAPELSDVTGHTVNLAILDGEDLAEKLWKISEDLCGGDVRALPTVTSHAA